MNFRIAILCSALCAPAAFATPVTVNFGGTLTQATSTSGNYGLEDRVHYGDKFSGVFEYDTSTAPYYVGSDNSIAQYVTGELQINVDGLTIETPTSWAWVMHDKVGGWGGFPLYQYLPVTVAGVPGATQFFGVSFGDFNANYTGNFGLFPDNGLPSSSFYANTDLSETMSIYFANGSDEFIMTGNIDSLSAVPEPATTTLLACAAVCIAVRRVGRFASPARRKLVRSLSAPTA